jgi:hypothetical protein
MKPGNGWSGVGGWPVIPEDRSPIGTIKPARPNTKYLCAKR